MKFLQAHWDKVILGVVIVIAGVIVAVSLSGGGGTEGFRPSPPAKEVLVRSNEVDYGAVVAEAGAAVVGELEPNVLSHEYLQRCTSCKKLIPRWALTCPECGVTVSYAEDSDKDGIPNDWERKYGLDWTDAADGETDADGDGLTNLAEYKRNSNPKDAHDPNLIADEYKLVSVAKPVRPITFVHYNKTGAGVTLHIRYKGKMEFKRPGDEITEEKKPVYKVETFTEKFDFMWNPQVNATQRVDRSEVEMTDLVTKERFVMVKGMTNYETRVEAKLVNLSSGKEVVVREGEVVELPRAKREARVAKLRDVERVGEFRVGEITYTVRVE
ncbi:MAG: hypothetical protein N2595_01685 [bacterium]|nr:hypothetical protein [bacterium]